MICRIETKWWLSRFQKSFKFWRHVIMSSTDLIISTRPSAMMNISLATSPWRHIKSPGVNMYAFIFNTRSCKNSGWHSWKMVTYETMQKGREIGQKLDIDDLIYYKWCEKIAENKTTLTLLRVSKLTWIASSVFSLSGRRPNELISEPFIRPL